MGPRLKGVLIGVVVLVLVYPLLRQYNKDEAGDIVAVVNHHLGQLPANSPFKDSRVKDLQIHSRQTMTSEYDVSYQISATLLSPKTADVVGSCQGAVRLNQQASPPEYNFDLEFEPLEKPKTNRRRRR